MSSHPSAGQRQRGILCGEAEKTIKRLLREQFGVEIDDLKFYIGGKSRVYVFKKCDEDIDSIAKHKGIYFGTLEKDGLRLSIEGSFIVFRSFGFTEHLGVLSGLTVFVMSAFGMVAPSPGGIGTWHFMVIQTLMVYGVSKTNAGAFAFASHESMTLMMIIVGVLSIVLLPVVNKKIAEKNKKNLENN